MFAVAGLFGFWSVSNWDPVTRGPRGAPGPAAVPHPPATGGFWGARCGWTGPTLPGAEPSPGPGTHQSRPPGPPGPWLCRQRRGKPARGDAGERTSQRRRPRPCQGLLAKRKGIFPKFPVGNGRKYSPKWKNLGIFCNYLQEAPVPMAPWRRTRCQDAPRVGSQPPGDTNARVRFGMNMGIGLLGQ